ncbi:MAG: hypothetical protein WED86_06520 [Chloroflexota bacterium]
MARRVAVYLEVGHKRTFACAVEWPGWSRGGRGEEEALAALLAYAPRYAKAIKSSGVAFAPPRAPGDLEVVEQLEGGGGTDFGVPGEAPTADDRPLKAAGLDRQSRLLTASWDAFDAAWSKATKANVELRKGPRGGGRDLPKIENHALEAEEAYLAQLGSRVPRLPGATLADRMGAVRATALDALAARAQGKPVADPRETKRPWSPRYFVRRSAWHVLDHAWEIEDRS